MKYETTKHVQADEIRKHVGNLIEKERSKDGNGAKARVAQATGTDYANLLSFIKGKIGPSKKLLQHLRLEARTVYVQKQGE